jgi:signal transduction histidine kinase/CheY-like chemotaxis protein/HAMP domain-containing protein
MYTDFWFERSVYKLSRGDQTASRKCTVPEKPLWLVATRLGLYYSSLMPSSASQNPSVGRSLNRVLLGVGVFALTFTLVLVYKSIVPVFQQEAMLALEQLMISRTKSESALFLQAGDNVSRLREALLERFDLIDPVEAEQEFNQRFSRGPDDLWRVRAEFDNHQTLPSLYLQHDAELSPSLYVRAAASYQLIEARGPALVPPYYSVYMDFVERGLMVYSPFVNWGSEATRETDNFNYPTMVGSDPKNNPNRLQFWTPVYFDEEARIWMVSVIEPLDWQGEWVGTVGHDVAIDELISQTLATDVDGTYGIILGSDGRLIAHPDFAKQIQASKGDLSLDNLNDPGLTRINELVSDLNDYPAVVDDPLQPYFYGVAKLEGPGWLMVTVWPKSLVEARAREALVMPAVAGVFLIIAALYLLSGTIRRLVLQPLASLDEAVDQLSRGEAVGLVPINETNEFGRLARSFEGLSRELDKRGASLSEAYDEWQRTFDSLLELVVITDANFNVKQANRAFLSHYEVTESTVVGHPRVEVLTASSQIVFENAFNQLLQTQQAQQFSIYSEKRESNYDISLVPYFNSKRELVGVVEVARNVTEQRRLEEQLRQSQKMDAIGHLAGGVAHDFNNLLQIILGYAESLEAEEGRSKADLGSVEQILQAGTKAAALTQQLLAFGRRQVIQTTQVNVGGMVSNTLRMVERLIESNVQIDFAVVDQNLVVQADENQLEQVIVNMCLNSRDAMPDGGKLEITVQKADPDLLPDSLAEHSGGYVHICLQDNGHGISPSAQARIFEPFFSTKDKNKGTGLGLATAYGIVEQHGGAIKVTSQPGEGARFCIFLPLVADASEIVHLPKAEEDQKQGEACILFAEDDATIRDLVTRMLVESGYEVLTAVNGSDALEVFEANSERIDLLMLDAMMPERSGHSVLAQVRLSYPNIPCLIASGYSEERLSEDLIGSDNTTFLTKPFRRADLLKEIRGLLDRQSSGNMS